jgi:hypothetical protein
VHRLDHRMNAARNCGEELAGTVGFRIEDHLPAGRS